MAIVFSRSTSTYHIRSVSLPTKIHPTTQTIEFELEKIKSWGQEQTSSTSSSSAGSICYGLTGLQELHQCIDDLLNLPSTIDALFRQKNRKKIDELLDMSIRILDICSIAKDIVTKCKENARDLQSSLRRKGLDYSTSITNYFTNRRQMKKEAKRSLLCLKQIDQQINASSGLDILDEDHVIRVLQEVNSTSISIFEAVLKFLSVISCKQRMKKWTLVAKLVQKGKTETESLNELENADVVLQCPLGNNQSENVQKGLRILEGALEGLENQLDLMFRCLVRSRTTILNVFSC